MREQNKPEDVSIHHRRPRSRGGSGNSSNLSKATRVQHQAWHTLFQDFDPETIATIINLVWLDPAWRMEARRK